MDNPSSSSSFQARLFPMRTPVPVADPIRAFKSVDNEEGTYAIQHGGQNYFATARRGQSLEQLVATGIRVNTLPSLTSQEPWIVTKIADQILNLDERGSSRTAQSF